MPVPSPPGATPIRSDELDLAQSAAGEEDPGASIDLPIASTPSAPAAGARDTSTPMKPGGQAPAGAHGTEERVCPDCGGSGRKGNDICATCDGTGKVIVWIGVA